MRFVVIDAEGNCSFSEKKEAPERFSTFAQAEKRARELADCDPGQLIGIYELAAEVEAPVGKTEVKRRK